MNRTTLRCAAFGGIALVFFGSGGRSRAAAPPPQVSPAASLGLTELQTGFERVARQVHPAIVSITSRTKVAPTSRKPAFGGGIALGTGSGFLIRSDGYIVTNDHVVEGADRVTVRLDDGREFPGIVYRDPYSDLAVVKIEARGLPTLSWQDEATAPTVGQWALAFGSPFALDDTMTHGIISALGRESVIGGGRGETVRYYPNLLQTDAAINPGNSGGPLVDLAGRVMGVDVAMGSPNGGSVGIGFAIPMRVARRVVDELIAKGKVTRGYLGFAPENLTPSDRARYGAQNGVLVAEIERASPAARAGMQIEDIVTTLNGRSLVDAADLREAISRLAPGTEATLQILRKGAVQTLRVGVQSLPQMVSSRLVVPPSAIGKLGFGAADLTPEVCRKLKLKPENRVGVVIAEVTPGSRAEEAGLEVGDLLLSIDGTPLKATDQIGSLLESALAAKRGDVALVVERESSLILRRISLE